jgi:hypothetical protein
MAMTQAIGFLRAALSGGPLPATVVRAQAKAANVSWAAARRAKQRIGVEARRESEGGAGAGRWLWLLPVQGAGQGVQGAQAAQVAPTQAAQPSAAQPPSRPRTITVKRPGIAPVGPDEISHELWQSLGCSVERLKEFLRQRGAETANASQT